MRSRRLLTAALLALAATLAVALLAGCGAGTSTVIFKNKTSGSERSRIRASEGGATTAEVEAEAEGEVPPQVPKELAVEAASPGFNAAQIYREAAPGVVTIRSVFGGAAGGAEGSGFVLAGNGEIVTNAHVVTTESGGEGSGGKRVPATEVFVEFENRNVLEAEIVGYDPFADVALLKVEPEGFALHPLELGNDSELEVGEPVAAIGSPFGEQRSLSVGVVSATDRRGEIADPVRNRGRDPDRRLDQPRQLRRPAARRRSEGGRDQPADRDQLGRQRRRRLRRADDGDRALGRTTARNRPRRIRLHRRLQRAGLPAAGAEAGDRHRIRRARRQRRPRRPGGEGGPEGRDRANSASRPPNTKPAAT